MRTARSARAKVALGATLIASGLSTTAFAEFADGMANSITVGDSQSISVGDSQSITVGDSQSISVGDVHSITVGDSQSITVGDTQSITVGDNQSITVGDIQSITVGDSQSITVGDIQSITVGDNQSITVGDIQSITVGDSQSITVGDSQSITVGDSQSITVGDSQSITVGDSQSITVGDSQSITVGDSQSITVGDSLSTTVGDSPVLAGPVDRIDQVNGVFESMGQVVLASQEMLAGLNVGDYVSVGGSVVSPGWLYADSLDVSSTLYVPGATEVFVSGMLSSVDRISGTAQIGGLTIDYTPSLAGGQSPSGTMWSFAGIRPTADGAMLSDRSIELR